ncbi:methionine--tRNA ligase [Paenibacillus woosongensis]|uniref:Methionine--tRNA ligase n=1 Tax=Paenibacillus woosongensis TaxID=307580 RepID=A0A7X3CNL7_9BACL|nr:methionine--tRNA ligase [Paenibacillus woosongensis]MUG45297.1 methionine--tRNA ligase [Paenibacillus woosongensis]
MKYTYITTPIYYASGTPHLGHAYSTILADCYNRYYKLRGYRSRLTTGTDEYGLKIERAAQKNNCEPQKFVDDLAEKFIETWGKLGIAYDDFIRTTEPRHRQVAQEIWKRMEENGDIYLGHYEGLYCVDCEQYYPESELLEGKLCPIHNRTVDFMREETYFFRMSKYYDRLLGHIEQHPEFIYPETRRNEVLGFLKHNPLQDLSISRTSFRWGIQVPGNESHIMYVWIDALTNYISNLGGFDSELFNQYWGNTIHIIGKDILKFHAIYWPCILMSAGVSLPKSLIVHGWWTISSKKISKSDPATKIDPTMLAEDITPDALKYYLLKELTVGRDGDLDYQNLISSINSGLANNLGNLVNRTIQMIFKYFDGRIEVQGIGTIDQLDIEIREQAFLTRQIVEKSMNENSPSAAINAIMIFSNHLNAYLEKTAPWQLAKQDDHKKRMAEIFLHIVEAIRWITQLGSPFFPSISRGITSQMNFDEVLQWPEDFSLRSINVNKAHVLFDRITKEKEDELIAKWQNPKL